MAKQRSAAYVTLLPEQIQILEPYQAVRLRPRLYFGDIDAVSTKTVLLTQFACMSADAAIAGRAVRLRVSLEEDGEATVEDDGPGMPIVNRDGRWVPEELLSLFRGCAHARENRWMARLYCDPGVAASNALCSRLELETRSGGRRYRQRFQGGKPDESEIEPSREPSGLRFRIALDPTIFSDPIFDADDVEAALAELQFLVPELTVQLVVMGRTADLSPLDLDELAMPPDRLALLHRALAIDLAVLKPWLEDDGLLPDAANAREAIRSLAVAIALEKHPRREATLRFRDHVAQFIDHLETGRTSPLEHYREHWERLAIEVPRHVMLTELLARGSAEDAAVEIDRMLESLI